MIRKRKRSYTLYAVFCIVIFIAGFYAAGAWTLPAQYGDAYDRFLKAIISISEYPTFFNSKLMLVWGAETIGLVYFFSNALALNRDTHSDIEHGSAHTESPIEVTKQLMDTEDPLNNRILSKNLRIALSGPKKLPNNNIIFMGEPGSGKSLFEIAPNLLESSACRIFLDVKGELLRKYGNYLREQGDHIISLNTRDMNCSDQYNPFRWIRKEEDIPRLITNIFESVDPPDAVKNDPFWDNGCALYLQSIFYFVWMVEYSEKVKVLRIVDKTPGVSSLFSQNLAEMEIFRTMTMNQVTFLQSLETMEVASQKIDKREEKATTVFELIVDTLAKTNSARETHPCVRDYRALKGGAHETVASIVLILNAKLKYFNSPAIKRIFADDSMRLDEIGAGLNYDGKTKIDLFMITSENDHTYDFIINMLYQQLFDTLTYTADYFYDGELPIRVDVWMDEFANGTRPAHFEKLITTLRSRNIAAMPFVQSISQVQDMYKGEAWNILFDACSAFVFLGCGRSAKPTQEYISQLLGNATLEKQSSSFSMGQNGNNSISNDRLQRPLMTPDEVGVLSPDRLIVLIKGHYPIIDKKNKPFDHENYKHAMSLGPYEHVFRITENADRSLNTEKFQGIFRIVPEEAAKRYEEHKNKEKEQVRIFEIGTEEDLLKIDIPKFAASRTFNFGMSEERALKQELEKRHEDVVMERLNQALKLKEEPEIIKKPEFSRVTDENADCRKQIELWLDEGFGFLDEDQENEIINAYQNGLSILQIQDILCDPNTGMLYTAHKMNLMWRLMKGTTEDKRKGELS